MAIIQAEESMSEKDRLTFTESDLSSNDFSDTESETDPEKRELRPVEENSEDEQELDEEDEDLDLRQPAPSSFKRNALILITLLLFSLVLTMTTSLRKGKNPHDTLHSSRYSGRWPIFKRC